MSHEALLTLKPYGLGREEKRELFSQVVHELTEHHRKACPEYGNLLRVLGCPEGALLPAEQLPMVPVSLFKEMDLKSIPDEEVFKCITSSGTSGQAVSKLYLDAETSAMQQRVLYNIVSDFVGEKRLPLLIIDSKKVLRDRAMFSARGAGILGFSIICSRSFYALDDNMELDLEGVRAFLAQHKGEKVLLFGFTYMVWKHLCRVLEERGERLDLDGGILIHGGGWKKLLGEAVSPGEFKRRVRAVTGVEMVCDYYGMAEQTGGIFMECPQGHLHASVWSEVLVRRAGDDTLCSVGEPGVLQLLSLLPRSYPGHSILTEDMGVLLGEDDCPCGRLGKYFAVTGRVPRAEVRGCSDTYEG